MTTCSVCTGHGWIYGDYPPCYACGGSGTGGFTNVACAACGGSGRGSVRDQLVCSGCGGSGAIADYAGAAPSAPRAKSRLRGRPAPAAKTRPQARPWTRNERLALLPAWGASAFGLNAGLDLSGWWLVGAAILPAILLVRAWKPIAAVSVGAALLWILVGQPAVP